MRHQQHESEQGTEAEAKLFAIGDGLDAGDRSRREARNRAGERASAQEQGLPPRDGLAIDRPPVSRGLVVHGLDEVVLGRGQIGLGTGWRKRSWHLSIRGRSEVSGMLGMRS